jgi:Kae1-associated kinase Bud32
MRGAEAVLEKGSLIGHEVVRKVRASKGYRVQELDQALRRERTRSEARLLHRAKLAGVSCPTVLEVDDFSIVMTFIDGTRPGMDTEQAFVAGSVLAKLHQNDIIHGDYTPANLIETSKDRGASDSLFVIDFGLGFVSNDIEDKATDVFTMLRALKGKGSGSVKNKKNKKSSSDSEKNISDPSVSFIDGYKRYEKSASVLERVKGIEKRVRYAF